MHMITAIRGETLSREGYSGLKTDEMRIDV